MTTAIRLPIDDNKYPMQMGSIVSADGINSSNTALGSAETFTGTWEVNPFPDVLVTCKTDNGGTLYFDFSDDGGTTTHSTFPVGGYKVSANTYFIRGAVKGSRAFRIRLVNDTGAQSSLELNTYFGNFKQLNAPLNQSVALDADAHIVRPTIAQDEIRIGRRSGVTGWTKFAYKTNTTAAGGDEMLWPASAVFTPLTAASTFTITYDGTGGGSTDGAGTTGATALTFYYIDSNGLPATSTHTLETDGSDVTSFSGLGINRVAVSTTGTNDVNASNITITATTGGSTQGFIPAGQGVTQQALFFVGSNHTAIAKYLFINVNKIGGGSPTATVKGWVYNRAVDSKFEVFRTYIDTSIENTVTINEPIGFNLNATDVLYFTIDTDTNSTVAAIRFSLNEYQNT